MLYTSDDDPELRDWLNFQSTNGSMFLRSLADLAKAADIAEYQNLRPALVSLRSQSPEPGSSVVNLITDRYRVTFSDSDSPQDLKVAFNRFNVAVFGNSLPETTIRWATSIRDAGAPGSQVGLLALPDDPVSNLLPTQFRLTMPYIFITARLNGVKPVDEFVLLHEMCHFKVRNHGQEFVGELQRALEQIHWSVLLGGY